MKKLHFELNMGAAGDMLAAALYELLDGEQKAAFIEKMNSLGLPGVSVSVEPSVKCGINGTRFKVLIDGAEELSEDAHHHAHHHEHHHKHSHDHHHDHDHDHDHDRAHRHEHRGLADIEHIVSHLPVSESCRENVMAVYSIIAEAESKAHGEPVELVHFHEVGALDAVADITAVCLLIELLAPEKITASPVCVGFGSVKCAHGILPVPAPATAHILKGVTIYAGEIEGELCTPTGAALIRTFAEEFKTLQPMNVDGIGYGMGKKDFAKANCVRAVLGEAWAGKSGNGCLMGSEILELCCTVDDMTGEEIGFALETFFELGAKDAYYIPIGMKKSRPGVMICVLCDPAMRAAIVEAMLKHTSTLGVRERFCRRYELSREVETLTTPLGDMRIKSAFGFGVQKSKPEYDDLARIARENGLSLRDAKKLIESAQQG